MGRRSSPRTVEQLHELIVIAASDIIEQQGYSALSVRAVASRIGYSPGTLYNVFDNLDHLVLTIEQRLLDSLAERLSAVEAGTDPVETLCNLAGCYLLFAQERPKLWNLLFEHLMPSGWIQPPAFQAQVERLRKIFEGACEPLIGNGDAAMVERTAFAVWGALHGLTMMATTEKLAIVTDEHMHIIVDEFMHTVARGLVVQNIKPKRRDRSA
jgi:AcrR family transcriptional regulator